MERSSNEPPIIRRQLYDRHPGLLALVPAEIRSVQRVGEHGKVSRLGLAEVYRSLIVGWSANRYSGIRGRPVRSAIELLIAPEPS